MKKAFVSLSFIFLLNSCFLGDQNLNKNEVKKGKIPHSYIMDYSQFFAVIVGTSSAKKWEVFYEDDENIYYGNLVGKNTIGRLYRVEKVLLERWIPLFNMDNIRSVITDNIEVHIQEQGYIIEDEIELRYVSILGTGSSEEEDIKYQFEISCYHKPAKCLFGNNRFKMNFIVIMDTEFNILEAYWLRGFK